MSHAWQMGKKTCTEHKLEAEGNLQKESGQSSFLLNIFLSPIKCKQLK